MARFVQRAFGVVVLVLAMSPALANHASQSCSASDTLFFAAIGSRHCEVTLSCPPSSPHACIWSLRVSVSGVGEGHGWIDGTTIDCTGINSCTASGSGFGVAAGATKIFMCLMDSPTVLVNGAMTCSATAT